MSKERSLFQLPNYRGQLGAVPWSQVVITPELEESLKSAALRLCPSCEGKGYRLHDGSAHPCTCLNRKPEAPGRAIP